MKWKQLNKELVYKSFLFDLFKVRLRSDSTHKEGSFDVLESKDWVNIIPITTDNHVVMVQQFRFGTQELSLEFPAGAIDATEIPLQAAQRELLEETGSEGEKIVTLGKTRPNPAFLNNTCHHFVAYGVNFKTKQNLDEYEEISFKKIPIESINDLIKDGKINHALSISAWYFYITQKIKS